MAVSLGLTAFILGGCQLLGPSNLHAGRMDYNDTIQSTSMTQTLANIVRVYLNEPTSFLDVNQISAGATVQGTLLGAGSMLGALTGQSGSASFGLQYQENPIIQYQPLSGQALIDQIGTPISLESIINLFDSDWPTPALLQLSINRLTPGYLDFGIAINALIALDALGAIELSGKFASATANYRKGKGSADAKSSNIPVLSVEKRVQQLAYSPDDGPVGDNNTARAYATLTAQKMAQANALWTQLQGVLNRDNRNFKLPVEDVNIYFRGNSTQTPVDSDLPDIHSMKTHSALGILKAGFDTRQIQIVSPQDYRELTGYSWNHSGCGNDFYVDKPSGSGPLDREAVDIIAKTQKAYDDGTALDKLPRQVRCFLTARAELDFTDFVDVAAENRLQDARRMVLIIHDQSRPDDAYAAYNRGGQWYYINRSDTISQRNFALLNQFLTIQASTTPGLSLQPTVSVGTH